MFRIDFHSHILPGVDDGSVNISMSTKMIELALDQGTDVLVLTPHFYPHKMTFESFFERRNRALAELIPVAQANKIRIRVGAEVAFFRNMSQSELLGQFVINGSHLILIEMPFNQWEMRDIDEIEQIINRGYIPLIAHLDRYISLQKDTEPLNKLLSLKIISQINCESLNSFFERRKVLKVIDNHPFVLGSDAHNLSNRAPNLYEGRQIIANKLGSDVLKKVDKLGMNILGYNKIRV